MSLKRIEIQFIQCDSCGEHAPVVFDSEHGPRVDGVLAKDAANEQGWVVNGDDKDICPDCQAGDDV